MREWTFKKEVEPPGKSRHAHPAPQFSTDAHLSTRPDLPSYEGRDSGTGVALADRKESETKAQGPVCPGCGVAAPLGARFCRACGAKLPETCRKCSAPLGSNARFCRSCGEPVATGKAPGTRAGTAARRNAVPRWVALPGLALVLVILGGFAWMLFVRGDGKENSGGQVDGEPLQSRATILETPADGAVDSVNGLPLRGRTRLDHPSGASADIPGGPALYGEVMDLRRVELANDPWWDHDGFGWEFVSFVGVPISGKATLDLPAGEPGTSVIVRTAGGLWAEMPTEAVTLRDGRAGLRVTVSNVPAPWTFAIARPKADAPALTADEQDDLRIERLYWTDRAAWESEMAAWLQTKPLARSIQDGRFASQVPPADASKEYDKIRAQMRFTLKVFGAARLNLDPVYAVTRGYENPLNEELSAQELWAAGVERLVVVKQNWLAFRATLDLANAQPNFQVAVYFVDQWIETAMHEYTPWGIDFVKALLGSGQLEDFDIRVLKPYGELKWTDLVLDVGSTPAAAEAFAQDELAHGKNPIADAPKVQRTLRLYSVRALERLAIIDWLKDNVDWVVRWLPVALAGAGLIPGAVGLSFAFAAADQILNWVSDWYTSGSEHPYAYMVMEGISAAGISGTSFVMDMAEERVLMQQAGRSMLPAHGLTLAQFAYSVGMFMAINQTDYYLFKTIREAAEGTRGYCSDGRCDSVSGGIPPVMLHIRGTGYLNQPEGSYPTEVDRLMSFRLRVSGDDYHATWLQGGRTVGQAIENLPFERYGESNWPTVVTGTQPQYQALRVAIPKSLIPPDVWGDRPVDAPLSEFGIELALAGPNGEAANFKLTDAAAKLQTDRADTFYTNILLRAPGERNLSGEELAWFGNGLEPGPNQQAGFEGNAALVMAPTGTLHFADPRIEPIPVAIAFEKGPRRVIMRSAGDDLIPSNEVARVHFGTATASTDIEGVYEIVKWQVTGGSSEITPTYLSGDLYSFGRSCEAPGVCTFEVYTVPGSGGEPERRRAMVCGPDEGKGRYCAGVADSKPYEPSGGLLPPTVNDNFFLLSGPILTGSDDWASHGNPGEPAIINSWHQIRAEFKDGNVTATLKTNQLRWDVVNAQVVNLHTVTLTVEFEAVKKK